jgi:hypothetical protein
MEGGMERILDFTGSARWIIDTVVADINRYTRATATVERNHNGISGRLTLVATTAEDLENAVEYLNGDMRYSHHFIERKRANEEVGFGLRISRQ